MAQATPSTFALEVANPIAAGSAVTFHLPGAGEVELSVYDARGRVVRTLVRGHRGAGRHSVTWDGHDAGGQPVATGLYFWTLEAAGQRETRKIIVSR